MSPVFFVYICFYSISPDKFYCPFDRGFHVMCPELDTLKQHMAGRLDRSRNWVGAVTLEQQQLTSELTQFHDIVLVDVVDVYRNVPYKLLQFVRWYVFATCVTVCLLIFNSLSLYVVCRHCCLL